MFIPGIETVGGFSMCSSPLRLQETQLLELAVKYSKHAPAYWIHTQVLLVCICWNDVCLALIACHCKIDKI